MDFESIAPFFFFFLYGSGESKLCRNPGDHPATIPFRQSFPHAWFRSAILTIAFGAFGVLWVQVLRHQPVTCISRERSGGGQPTLGLPVLF